MGNNIQPKDPLCSTSMEKRLTGFTCPKYQAKNPNKAFLTEASGSWINLKIPFKTFDTSPSLLPYPTIVEWVTFPVSEAGSEFGREVLVKAVAPTIKTSFNSINPSFLAPAFVCLNVNKISSRVRPRRVDSGIWSMVFVLGFVVVVDGDEGSDGSVCWARDRRRGFWEGRAMAEERTGKDRVFRRVVWSWSYHCRPAPTIQ